MNLTANKIDSFLRDEKTTNYIFSLYERWQDEKDFTELKAAEANRQKREDERYEKLVEHQLIIENAAGYCKKCGTFCFGDCMSNS